jgi:AraC-like DNA-binding protein
MPDIKQSQLNLLLQHSVSADNGLILPFVASAAQQLRRVPFNQPCLMLILQGVKQLHQEVRHDVLPGQMLLVPAGCELSFTNQPDAAGVYQAWVVPFHVDDLQHLSHGPVQHDIVQLPADGLLLTLLQQWLLLQAEGELAAQLLPMRRIELVQHLCARGLSAHLRSGLALDWAGKVQALLRSDVSRDWQLAGVCQLLALSESNLRRKLNEEGRSFRRLLEDVRLSHGLNLLQTSALNVQQVADACGYISASRFSERFRLRFGLSPSDLRNSRSALSGEKLAL